MGSSGNYSYRAFGIQLESEIELPELHTCEGGSADVHILYGNVPTEIQAPFGQGSYYQVAKDEFLLRVEGVARYYITEGHQIVVQPFNQDLREVRLYLLGTAMGVLLMQRGILPLHGSAVVMRDRCLIFTGVSGAGKSTLAAALRKKGYSLLADDISAVTFDNQGLPWVQSGYPQQKLWQVSASMLGIDTRPLQRICQDQDKYAVPVLGGFWRDPVRLDGVYELKVQPGGTMGIVPMKGVEKIATILHHTYRAELVEGLGLKLAHFKQCAALAKQIPIVRLTRPEGVPSLNWQVEALERHFAKTLWTK